MEQQEPNIGWTEALGEEGSNPAEPRTSGFTVTALGQDWPVSSCTNAIKAQFEGWIRRGAMSAVQAVELEDPDEADKMRRAYIADYSAGQYNWGSRHIRNALKDLPGIQYLLFLLLRRCHPKMTETQAKAVFEENPKDCSMAIRWALGNSSAPLTDGAANGKIDSKEKMITREQ